MPDTGPETQGKMVCSSVVIQVGEKKTLPILITFSNITLSNTDRTTQNRVHNAHARPLRRILETHRLSSLGHVGKELA